MNDIDRQKELIRLVELDYERTTRFVQSLVTTGTTLRGWAITLWVGAIGVSFTTHQGVLSLLAAAVIAVFGLVDAYHSWLYEQAMRHARRVERVSALYFASLSRGDDDPDLQEDAQTAIEGHQFGLYTTFRRFHWRDLWFVRPRPFFRYLYPALIGVAFVAALWLGPISQLGSHGTTNTPKTAHTSPSILASPVPASPTRQHP